MQTTKISIKVGQALSPEQAAFLASCFKPEEIEAALKQGVNIRVSLISPWPKPKKVPAEVVIEPALLDELKSLIDRPDELEARIAKLNGPQILKIGSILGIPMSKQKNTEALRARLFGSLRSEAVWRSISGQPALSDTTKVEDTPLADARPRKPTGN